MLKVFSFFMVRVTQYSIGSFNSVLSPNCNVKLYYSRVHPLHLHAARVIPLREVGDGRLHLEAARAGLSDGETDRVLGIKILLDEISRYA